MKYLIAIALVVALVNTAVAQNDRKQRISGSFAGNFPPVRDFISDLAIGEPMGGEFTLLQHKVLKERLIGQTITGHALAMSGVVGAYHTYTARDRCPGTATTSQTSAANNCKMAVNAGFFNMADGSCIGPIVSDGRIIHTSSSQGAVFGITSDGKYVAGYANASVIDQGYFKQLVQGRGWLVHNGKSYLEPSAQIEEIERKFITLIAPRQAIGWDAQGRLILVIVDGIESKKKGLDLVTFTDMLIRFGLVEAINLDGGGSVTFVWDGHICESNGVGQEKCEGNPDDWEAPSYFKPYERPITSIICFRPELKDGSSSSKSSSSHAV